MKLTIEAAGGGADRSITLRETHALESGVLYNPLDVELPSDVASGIADPGASVAVVLRGSDGSTLAQAAGFSRVADHRRLFRSSLNLATEPLRDMYAGASADGLPVVRVSAVLSVEVNGSSVCSSEVPLYLRQLSGDLVKGLDGRGPKVTDEPLTDADGVEIGRKVTFESDGREPVTVVLHHGTNGKNGADGTAVDLPAPVVPGETSTGGQYASASGVWGLVDGVSHRLGGEVSSLAQSVGALIDAVDGLSDLPGAVGGKVDSIAGFGLVPLVSAEAAGGVASPLSQGSVDALQSFASLYGVFGALAARDAVGLNQLDDGLAQALGSLRSDVDRLLSATPGADVPAEHAALLSDMYGKGLTAGMMLAAVEGVAGLVDSVAGKVDAVQGKGLSTFDFDQTWKDAINGKVDAVQGKGLSTYDFDQTWKDAINGKVTADPNKTLSSNDFTDNYRGALDRLMGTLLGETAAPAVDPALKGRSADAYETAVQLKGKVDEVQGKGLSSNDYTDEDRNLVRGIGQDLTETVRDRVSEVLEDGYVRDGGTVYGPWRLVMRYSSCAKTQSRTPDSRVSVSGCWQLPHVPCRPEWFTVSRRPYTITRTGAPGGTFLHSSDCTYVDGTGATVQAVPETVLASMYEKGWRRFWRCVMADPGTLPPYVDPCVIWSRGDLYALAEDVGGSVRDRDLEFFATVDRVYTVEDGTDPDSGEPITRDEERAELDDSDHVAIAVRSVGVSTAEGVSGAWDDVPAPVPYLPYADLSGLAYARNGTGGVMDFTPADMVEVHLDWPDGASEPVVMLCLAPWDSGNTDFYEHLTSREEFRDLQFSVYRDGALETVGADGFPRGAGLALMLWFPVGQRSPGAPAVELLNPRVLQCLHCSTYLDVDGIAQVGQPFDEVFGEWAEMVNATEDSRILDAYSSDGCAVMPRPGVLTRVLQYPLGMVGGHFSAAVVCNGTVGVDLTLLSLVPGSSAEIEFRGPYAKPGSGDCLRVAMVSSDESVVSVDGVCAAVRRGNAPAYLNVAPECDGDRTLHAVRIGPGGTCMGTILGGDVVPHGRPVYAAHARRNDDLEGFATEADLLAFYYPDGSVTSMDQITTSGIEYAVGNDDGAYVVSGNDLSGHVVLPWKVDIGGKEYKVTVIGSCAFDEGYYNNGFAGFTAPITVNMIGDDAFSGCTGLTSVNLPSATSIGASAFSGCTGLTSVNLPSATSIGTSAFSDCTGLTSVSLPSATIVEDYAFSACSGLTSVSLPSAALIGYGALNYCSSLSTVDFGSSPKSAVPSFFGDAFDEVPTSCKFIIPLGMYDEWVAADGWAGMYAQGYKFEGYASTEQVKEKRDKTDNIAVADSMEFTKWKFHCDVPEIQAALEGYSAEGHWSSGYWFIRCPDVSGYMTTSDSWPGAEDAVSLSNDSVYQDQTEGVLVTVTATREKVVVAKSGEPYVTLTGVKSLLPTPFHALTPGVTDTAVTLKPVDGAANWVNGIVQGLKYTEPTREFQNAYIFMLFQDVDSGDSVDVELSLEKEDVANYYIVRPDDRRVAVGFQLSRAVSVLYSSDQSELTTLPEGTSFETLFLEMEDSADFVNQGSFTWHEGNGEYSYIGYPSGAPTVEVDGRLLQASDNFYYAMVSQAVSASCKSPVITLPASADTAKARRFSLALETDADSEKEVTWQGGEVIEALPGASKLVPGLNVWDVAEVAPGKFKVERASNPAQSVPLTLTAPGGRVAELTVDDDLVLEVKEK